MRIAGVTDVFWQRRITGEESHGFELPLVVVVEVAGWTAHRETGGSLT